MSRGWRRYYKLFSFHIFVWWSHQELIARSSSIKIPNLGSLGTLVIFSFAAIHAYTSYNNSFCCLVYKSCIISANTAHVFLVCFIARKKKHKPYHLALANMQTLLLLTSTQVPPPQTISIVELLSIPIC